MYMAAEQSALTWLLHSRKGRHDTIRRLELVLRSLSLVKVAGRHLGPDLGTEPSKPITARTERGCCCRPMLLPATLRRLTDAGFLTRQRGTAYSPNTYRLHLPPRRQP
jgi:hypothetical protein